MDIKVNVSFQKLPKYQDSETRAVHAFERMRLRGIGVTNIKDAVKPHAVKRRSTIIYAFLLTNTSWTPSPSLSVKNCKNT